MKHLKKTILFAAIVSCFAMTAFAANDRDLDAEKASFLETLEADGYAEVGTYKVEEIIEDVYHMDESTIELPGGALDEDGSMNNPSSIYFVVEEDDVLIVDNGNPAEGDAEIDAKIIMEAMTDGKEVTMIYTHGHGDHTGLAQSTEVFENVDVEKVYIAEEDYEMASEAIAQFSDITETLQDGDCFTVGGKDYTVYIVNAHTNGSLMIVNEDREVIFTGDTFGSGFVWLFWDVEEGDPLTNLSTGVTQAQSIINEMVGPTILAGHRWQQFWEGNEERPEEITIKYFNDMSQVLSGIANSTTSQSDYSNTYEGGVELSASSCKAKIDTTPEFIDIYLDNLYKMDEAYVYNAAVNMSVETSNPTAAAVFIVFPDGMLTDEEAKELLDETGITDIVDESASVAYVARPSNGESFTEEDMSVFYAIAGRISVTNNLKFVGFGNGATFVNQYLTEYANMSSGILTVGGEAGPELTSSVPAYISGDVSAAEPYIAADNAEETETDGTITTYVNPDSHYELVVTNSAAEDPAEAFQNGWNLVLRKFCRIGNYIENEEGSGTYYTRPIISGDEEADSTRLYQYFDSADGIDNITRTIVTEDLNNDGIDSLWYVYIPEQAEDAEDGTVPVVFLMHGNTNDPRTQYDSSGWATIASEEGIILVCPEWQGHTFQGYTYDAMTSDNNLTPNSDFIKVVEEVLEDYPQIDASRVYISGLSAGCMNTTANGLANPGYFAAGAGHSGPFDLSSDLSARYDMSAEKGEANVEANKDAYDFPIIYFTGDRDENMMDDFDKLDQSEALSILQLFEELNDMDVTQVEDLVEENIDIYGIPWDDVYVIEADEEGICRIIGGTIANEDGVEISMNRICGWGHWNYAPDAQIMWDFMSKYSRDPETGEISISE